jgi:NIMA (never in mitosis gene a)-related kinase
MRREPQNDYQIESLIGKGCFASVYKATCLADKSSVAIKMINIQRLGNSSLTAALNEIRILSSLDCPYIVKYYESFIAKSESQLWIVMELLEGGDLADLIDKTLVSKTPINEKVLWTYFIQALMGLKSLHHLGIIHRDLKPNNIFLTGDKKSIKIGDMNASKIVDKAFTRTMVGSPGYLAPEIWRSQPYNLTCDSFALGCAIFELASGNLPFQAESLPEMKANILAGNPNKLPKQYSAELQIIIDKCLSKFSSLRPTATQLLEDVIVRRKIRDIGLPRQKQQPTKIVSSLIKIPKQRALLNKSLPNSRPASPPKKVKIEVNKKSGKTYLNVLKNSSLYRSHTDGLSSHSKITNFQSVRTAPSKNQKTILESSIVIDQSIPDKFISINNEKLFNSDIGYPIQNKPYIPISNSSKYDSYQNATTKPMFCYNVLASKVKKNPLKGDGSLVKSDISHKYQTENPRSRSPNLKTSRM